MADAARDRKDLSHRFYSPCQLDDQRVELQALVDEARAGSSDAHGQLLNDLRPKMVAYFSRRLSRKLAQKASEQDLAQEASLFAFRKFEQFSGATLAKYSGWLMGICRNVLRHLERMFGPGSDRDLSREELLDELRLAMESQRPFLRRRQAAPDVVAALESAGQLKRPWQRCWKTSGRSLHCTIRKI